jgi:TRAP-type C4-dicarboxylate transport system permease small subunit
MKKAYEKFCQLEQWIAMALLAGITILVFVSAMMRTIGFPLNWAQDAALIMFAWLSFIGGDIALHSTGLIGVDLIVTHFPKPVQKAIDILFKVIMLAFLAVLVYFGYQYVMTGYKRLITTLNVSGKAKRVGRYPQGTTKCWKKAVVRLTADSKPIEFFEGMV